MLDACLLHGAVHRRIARGRDDQQSADDILLLEWTMPDRNPGCAATIANIPRDVYRDNLDLRPGGKERLDLAVGHSPAADHQTRLIDELECERKGAHRSSRVLPPM